MGEGMPSLSPTRISRELTEYRRDQRYLYTHYPGSLFWPELPYELDPAVWLDYYHKTDLYTRMFEGSPLYLHAIVTMPSVSVSVYYLATIIYTSRNNKYIHKISRGGKEGHKKPQGLYEMDLLNPRV